MMKVWGIIRPGGADGDITFVHIMNTNYPDDVEESQDVSSECLIYKEGYQWKCFGHKMIESGEMRFTWHREKIS